ncbi:NAD-P-binding protein [Russula earlei]|uniref:NAD-P-binding protein n=1 Tax=Russula earlei TaxID=71964 RepID=A0ACC0TY41_9AGAM|nr:NAD-P-binding protein [Russula earlei]
MSFLGLDEDLKVSSRLDIYPTIDPKVHYDAQTFSGKVVLITGASRGIGAEIALQYARAGAKLSLVARTQAALDAIRDAILRERPTAQILTFPADVRDVTKAGEIVASTVARFGRLDILVSNAAILRRMDLPFASKDPKGWWDVVEVNIRGTYNYIHFAVPELLKRKANWSFLHQRQLKYEFQQQASTAYRNSPLIVSQSLSPLVNLVLYRFRMSAHYPFAEYPDIKVFAVHPGGVKTDMYADTGADFDFETNTVGLSAATILYLTSGNADYLNGRYVSSTWDLGEVERDWKEKILAQNGLVSKLSIPV